MDRNHIVCVYFVADKVALRKESVDRNGQTSRRAGGAADVALRKESVDRNTSCSLRYWSRASLSARRAWIEIHSHPDSEPCEFVALRKESVDRNDMNNRVIIKTNSRSPQGERG